MRTLAIVTCLLWLAVLGWAGLRSVQMGEGYQNRAIIGYQTEEMEQS